MPLAQRELEFTDSIGVQTHLTAGEGNAYTALPFGVIEGDLRYLGVDLIRDGYSTDVDPTLAEHYALLAQAGFKFDMGAGSSNSDLTSIIAGLNAFVTTNPGSLKYVEGPNEINYFPFSYEGQTSQAAAVAFQANLDAAVKGDPLLTGVQVLDFTGGGGLLGSGQAGEPVSGIADLANVHLYPANGDPPAWYIPNIYQSQYGQALSQPYVVTETGYNSDPNYVNGVTPALQAAYTLDMLLDEGQSGASAIFLYELLDMYSDPSDSNPDDHWGLFNADGSPKPVATGVHNLLTTLSDDGSSAATFTPGNVNYSITNLPWMGHSWLLEKSSGVFDLAVWAEPPVWNASTQTETIVPREAVTVNLGQVYGSVSVFNPLVSTTPVSTYTNVQQISLTLTNSPLVIEFSNNPIISYITGVPYTGVRLTGTSTAGSTVTITDTVGGRATLLGTTVASYNGSWSFLNTSSLGRIDLSTVHDYSVSSQNSAGNTVNSLGTLFLTDTGQDVLTATPGRSDIFAIMSFQGSDVINDFQTATAAGAVHDIIDFSGRGLNSFSQVQALMSGTGSAIVTLPGSKAITLTDVAPASLTAADFRFS